MQTGVFAFCLFVCFVCVCLVRFGLVWFGLFICLLLLVCFFCFVLFCFVLFCLALFCFDFCFVLFFLLNSPYFKRECYKLFRKAKLKNVYDFFLIMWDAYKSWRLPQQQVHAINKKKKKVSNLWQKNCVITLKSRYICSGSCLLSVLNYDQTDHNAKHQ